MATKTKTKDNLLITTHPELAAQWHPTKNTALSLTQITHGSNKKAWWLCPNGHEWEASVLSRSQGSGCPCCAGYKAIEGETDLVTTRPDLAAQWHPTKNAGLLPSQVSRGSNKKVWWLCPNGHEWEARVHNRDGGTGCPYCFRRRNHSLPPQQNNPQKTNGA